MRALKKGMTLSTPWAGLSTRQKVRMHFSKEALQGSLAFPRETSVLLRDLCSPREIMRR